ncbi:intercellular adhesion molecule 5-like [Platysternon megacephalum]|uniref:Intercellular adhesion molecule 5-like n=1 Tax=Platysternon megacephalum TaxID=55544 RepID=A0A4D9DMN7_9SAUR|nr:intercellular adhesion molecule 5-like [Platysternon megacephalum]
MTGLEKPLALTPSQHLVAGELPGPGLALSQSLEASMETGEAGSGAFDPDCFLNSPARGQTYGRRAPEPPPPGNRFFIQDDGGAPGRGGGETPMETGGPRPGDGAGEQLPEELYSIIQTGAGGGPELPFGLSLDSLISELMTEGAGAGSSPPCPALPDAPGEAAPPGGSAAPQPLVTITDFSPDWSYPEGGVKVLITGPWTEETDSYTCLFDRLAVPAALIQSGVLRCYCPDTPTQSYTLPPHTLSYGAGRYRLGGSGSVGQRAPANPNAQTAAGGKRSGEYPGWFAKGSMGLDCGGQGTFLTKKQDQAARKIMRFLRRCRHRMKELKQSKEVESLQKRGLAT